MHSYNVTPIVELPKQKTQKEKDGKIYIEGQS